MSLRYEMYLAHHGILGQKWGVRRYQNEDGTLTLAGKERYYKQISKTAIAASKNGANAYAVRNTLATKYGDQLEAYGKERSKNVRKSYNDLQSIKSEVRDLFELGDDENDLKYRSGQPDLMGQLGIARSIIERKSTKMRDLGDAVDLAIIGDDHSPGIDEGSMYFYNKYGHVPGSVCSKAKSLAQRYDAATREYDNAVIDLVNKDFDLKGPLNGNKRTATLAIRDFIDRHAREDLRVDAPFSFKVHDLAATDPALRKPNRKLDSAMKTFRSHLGGDSGNWNYLNEAIHRLDLGDKDYTELTNADWNRINAEIKREKDLRKRFDS